MATVPADITAAVFYAAANSDNWTNARLGMRTTVRIGGSDYTVEIPADGERLACIVARVTWGRTEWVEGAGATPQQHRELLDVAEFVTARR